MGIVQLAESQGAIHAKTTQTGPDRGYPMFGVADPFAGVTRAGIWLVFRGFLGDPRVLS